MTTELALDSSRVDYYYIASNVHFLTRARASGRDSGAIRCTKGTGAAYSLCSMPSTLYTYYDFITLRAINVKYIIFISQHKHHRPQLIYYR